MKKQKNQMQQPRINHSRAEFKKLQQKWYLKLKKSGFEDIEDSKQNLKQYDKRTISYQNAGAIRDFYYSLDHYLNDNPEIPKLHMLILSLYSEGKYLTEISVRAKRSTWTIWSIIKTYKKKILTGA